MTTLYSVYDGKLHACASERKPKSFVLKPVSRHKRVGLAFGCRTKIMANEINVSRPVGNYSGPVSDDPVRAVALWREWLLGQADELDVQSAKLRAKALVDPKQGPVE